MVIWIGVAGIVVCVALIVALVLIELRRSFGIVSRAQAMIGDGPAEADPDDDWGFPADWAQEPS